ncbi:MAG: MBOAT family protein [Bacteroidaceae bacterium]|nr:MBOAT family protein [Bacteroidaceae bacterium]
MLFNSLAFLFFFPAVALLYWLLPTKMRNGMLLISSYYFYMNWDPVYALLILFSTATTWMCSMGISKSKKQSRKKVFLSVCLVCNLAILIIYKYLNFFTESVFQAFNLFGLRMDIPHFNLLLPVGISFYTFQAIGYTIDVYRKTIEPEKNFFTYALFVSFFPQLVAGPIERAKNLLPQFHTIHKFKSEDCIEGLKLMIWGYFMKLCIAENVSSYVDAVYNNLSNHNGTSVLLATFFFTFQIFCDFSGYSLIAIGTARCLGFTLMQNFNHPYLSRSFREFWRRWHISLSSWFSDYVYIPLGGSRCSEKKHLRNLFLTMLASGVWHGANWTFIMWGGVHGILLCANSLKRKFIKLTSQNPFVVFLETLATFLVSMLCWIFFRANTLSDALLAFRKIFTQPGQLYNGAGKPAIVLPILLIGLLMYKEIKDEYFRKPHQYMHNSNEVISILSTAILVVIILSCAQFEGEQFIYFQF